MGVTTYTQEIKVRVSAKRMFKAMTTEAHNILPKVNPYFKSIDTLQGDGGVGTIRQANHPDGSYSKHRVDAMDTENNVKKFTIIEGGGVGDKFDSIAFTQNFEDSSDGGCTIKVTTEYHCKGDVELKNEDIKDQDPKFYTVVEDYLVAHPQICA